MIVKGHRVYRGHRAANTRMPAVLLFIAVFLVLLWLGTFSLLPQYLVYHRDHVEMVMPMLEESGEPYTVEAVPRPAPFAGNAVSSVEIAAPDYSLVNLTDLAGMNYLRGFYVPINKVTESGLDSAVKDAQRNGLQGLVIQMKDESGKLAWVSEVAMASSNAANSAWDPSAVLSELKSDGWFLAAEVCCSVDTLLATQNPDLALRDHTGAVYEDGNGCWVDPWNRTVRTYTVELCQDLLRMGFDEIILTRVEHPSADVGYTREVAAGLGRETCVMNYAIAVREGLEKTLDANRAHLCVKLNHNLLTAAEVSNGQNLDNFLKVFDRVVVSTATYSEDVAVFLERKVDSTLRFVPQMTWAFGGASVILDPTAPTA